MTQGKALLRALPLLLALGPCPRAAVFRGRFGGSAPVPSILPAAPRPGGGIGDSNLTAIAPEQLQILAAADELTPSTLSSSVGEAAALQPRQASAMDSIQALDLPPGPDDALPRNGSAGAADPTAPRVVHMDLGGTIGMRQQGGVRGGSADSSQMLFPHLAELARRVKATLDGGSALYISQGTDSLDATGMVLSQLFSGELMALTAAFHDADQPGSDGPENLRGARVLALLRGRPGVPQVPYAVMNGRVFLASSLVKLDTDFLGGRRGLQSYAGSVGRIVGDAVEWDAGFLRDFERRRGVPPPGARDFSALGGAEIAYVNEHTPRGYIRSVLSRLWSGESRAAVFHGVFPSSEGLLAELRSLRARGKPIYVQRFARAGVGAALFPRGIEPFQLLYKLSAFLGETQGLAQLRRLLSSNIAGEIVGGRGDPALSLDVVEGNFYRGDGVSRGFLLYHPDLPLMRAALAAEVARLRGGLRRGGRAELILEGIGNGHIHLGLLDLLEEAKRLGITVTLSTRVKDAVADASYEVGRELARAEVRLSPHPGRGYLKSLAGGHREN